jgi:hypothetical protein
MQVLDRSIVKIKGFRLVEIWDFQSLTGEDGVRTGSTHDVEAKDWLSSKSSRALVP